MAAPEGLVFVPNIITEEEETFLFNWANTFDWDHDVPTRNTVQFGYKYSYDSKTISRGRPWDKRLDMLMDKLKPYMKGLVPNQVIVNDIHPPNGFGAHIDDEAFDDPVALISTNGGVNIIFEHKDGRRYHVVRSQRRSLIAMTGQARNDWYHSIPEGVDDAWKGKLHPRKRRISWTVRVMRQLIHDE